MITIFKYPIGIEDMLRVRMPQGAKLLTVQIQPRVGVCLWAEVDTDKPMVDRMIATYGTGDPCHGGKYVATYQFEGLVFHVYDKGEGT